MLFFCGYRGVLYKTCLSCTHLFSSQLLLCGLQLALHQQELQGQFLLICLLLLQLLLHIVQLPAALA